MRGAATFVVGLGVTIVSTFSGSLGLSKHEQRIALFVGFALIVAAVVVLLVDRRRAKANLPDLEEVRRRLRDFALELHDLFRTTDSPVEALETYRHGLRPPDSTVTYRRAGIALLNLARRKRLATLADELKAERTHSVARAANLFNEVAARKRRWWRP
jgi:hypothetical protein